MRKINFIYILFLLAVFNSCQKEDDQSYNSQNREDTFLSVIYPKVFEDMLFFETLDNYENSIQFLTNLGDDKFDSWENNVGFYNSMRRKLNEQERIELGIEDNLLASIINPDGYIRIADDIFQIDVLSGVVLSINASDYTGGRNLSDLSLGNQIITYSIDDDIVGIIKGEQQTIRSSYCGSQKKGYYHITTHNGYDVKYKIAYQRAGLYNSLIAKIKKESAASNVKIGLHTISTTGFNFWRNKKRKKKFSRGWKSGYSTVYSWRPYGSSRRLKGYKYHVEFLIDDGGYEYWMPKLEITCGSY